MGARSCWHLNQGFSLVLRSPPQILAYFMSETAEWNGKRGMNFIPVSVFFFFFFLFFFFLCSLGPHLVPRLGMDRNYSFWPTPQPQQHRIWAASATYTTAHGNTGSLTHWARPGIKPATSRFLVRFVSSAPRRELQEALFLKEGWCQSMARTVRAGKQDNKALCLAASAFWKVLLPKWQWTGAIIRSILFFFFF